MDKPAAKATALQGRSPVEWYIIHWMSFFTASLAVCLSAAGLYHLPLEQVANVCLAFCFTYLMFVVALWQIPTVIFLLKGRMEEFGMAVASNLALLLLFFAPVLGLQFYAQATHVDLHQSWVFERFDGVVQHTIAAVFIWLGEAIGAKIGPLGSVLVQMGDRASWLIGLLSGLVTLVGAVRQRRAAPAHH